MRQILEEELKGLRGPFLLALMEKSKVVESGTLVSSCDGMRMVVPMRQDGECNQRGRSLQKAGVLL